jgi:hypothetical protein
MCLAGSSLNAGYYTATGLHEEQSCFEIAATPAKF